METALNQQTVNLSWLEPKTFFPMVPISEVIITKPDLPFNYEHMREMFLIQTIMEERDDCYGKEDCDVEHIFHDGVYHRQMKLAKGHLVMSEVHRFGCVGTLSKGIVRVWNETGEGIWDASESPTTALSTDYSKRMGLALTDCVFTTSHRTDATTVEQVLAELIVPEQEIKQHLEPFSEEELAEYRLYFGKEE